MKLIKCKRGCGRMVTINVDQILLIEPSMTNKMCSVITMEQPIQANGLRKIVIDEEYNQFIERLQSL